MANKQVGVNIAFSADTSKAKASIQELQTLLNKITYSGVSSTGQTMTKDLQNASAAAKELQYHLNNAYNANTGKLDLSLLDKSLKTTGSNITNLSTQLLTAGTTGQQAFVKIAQSIAQAEQPVLRVNSKVKDLVKTLGNAAKYQLGNMVVQGMISSVSSAIGYAKDLNSSLNEIRIVSGKNADEMARFAEEANKAAKRLSATTLDYTNASVIYAQQGLNDDEIAARTETTIKMANVAGTSAQTVSDQMTAVWNNFYDGSKSLEYYSDVMVKLGAATASSTDEISEGVNKFAATAKTVGLSYEYATAALATVTATTRESADTVGNAYKTLFSRIQGLNLGETQDDGTTLNKYSQALANVGVNIKDTSGQLKDMDTILDELGEKWQTLAKDEQVALAETVGGARQYTQLMALLDNWDYFKENLDVAYNSEGALEEQAQIYAESWDAASNKVQAALEGVYQSILDDKFFISLNNGFANALGGLEAFIEGAGGVKTVITGITSLVLGSFADKIPEALQTAKYNFDILTKGSQEAYKTIQTQMQEATNAAFTKYQKTAGASGIDINSATGVELQYTNDLFVAKNKLAQITDKMSAAEKQQYQTELSLIEAHQKETIALQRKCEELESSIELQRQELIGTEKYYGVDAKEINNKQADIFGSKEDEYFNQASRYYDAGLKGEAQSLYTKSENYGIASEIFAEATDDIENFTQKVNQAYESLNDVLVNRIAKNNRITYDSLFDDDIIDQVTNLKTKLEDIANLDIDDDDKLSMMKNAVQGISEAIPPAIQKATGLQEIFTKIGNAKSVGELEGHFDDLTEAMSKATIEGKDFEEVIKSFQRNSNNVNTFSRNVKESAENVKKLGEQKDALANLMKEFEPTHIVKTSEAIASLAAMLGSIITVGNSFSSMIKSWFNPDLSGWEKISATVSAAGMAMTSGMNVIRQYSTAIAFLNQKMIAHGVVLETSTIKQKADAAATLISAQRREYLTKKIGAENVAKLLSIALAEKEKGADEKEIAVKLIKSGLLDKIISKKNKEAMASWLAKAAIDVETKSVWGLVTSFLALQVSLLGIEAPLWVFVAAIAAAAAVIYGIVKLVDWLVVTQAEANEAISEANSAYEEEKNKVNELKSSLESLQKQIEELENKDTLTLTEEEELQKLREEEASLKRQLALQEQIAKTKQREAAQTFKDNFKTSTKWANNGPYLTQETNKIDLNGNNRFMTAQEYYDEYVKPLEDAFDNNPENDTIIKALKEEQSAYEELLANEEKIRSNYIEENQENYNNLIEGYKNWLEQNPNATPEDKATYARTIQQANKNFYGEDNWEEVVYGSVSSVKSAAEKKSGSTFASWIQDAYAAGEELAAAGAQLAGTFSTEFANELYANGIIPEDYAQWLISEQQEKIEHVAEKLGEDGTEQLKKAMEDERWTDTSLDILDQIDLGEIDVSDLDALFQAITDFSNTNVVQDLRADLEALITTTQELSIGDILSEEDYELLVKYNEELEKYFMYTGSGYKYLGGADDEIANLGIDEYLAKQQQYQELSQYFDTWRADGKEVDWLGRSADHANGNSDYGSAQLTNFVQSEKALDFLSDIDENYTQDYLQNIIDKLDSEEEGIRAEGEKLAKEFWNSFNNAYSEGSEWTDEKANEVRYSPATTFGDLEKTHTSIQDDNAYEKQLRAIAGQYEECEDALNDYNKAVEEAAGDAKKLKKAQENLAKAIKKTEWDNFTDDALEYAQALKEATSSDDIQKNLKAIQKAFKEDMGFEVSMDALDKYKDKFIEWAYAGEEASDDIATQLYSLLQLEENVAEEFATFGDNEIILEVGAETVSAETSFANLEDFYASVKEIVEGNPPVVDAQGNADFSNMIAAMLEAGYTAADVAAALQSIGQTEVDFSAWGSSLPNVDFSDIQSIINFINALNAWKGEIAGDTNAPITSQAIKDVFGGSLPAATGSGGGRHTSSGNNSGGGGSSSTPKHAEKKNDSDKERYHTLINQLEDLNAEYDAISEAKDRAFGKDKLKNLDAEIAKTDELISKQEEYLNAIAADLPVDKAVMDAYYQDVIGGPAIEYDERGNIANYDAIQDAMYAKWNAMADAYDEDSTEWEVFEKKYEQLEKYIEQYEETYDLLRDEEQEYQDLLNQRIDLQLEKVQYTVEVQLEVSEDGLAVIEYQLGRIDDDGFKSLESIGLLSAKADEVYKQIQINKEGLNEALKLSLSAAEISQVMAGNMDVLNDKNFTEDQIDAIREYRDSLLELNEEFDDIREEIEEKLMEAFDAWQEKLEKGIDTIDHYGSVLESYKNIIDIVGTETLGLDDEFMNKLSQGSVDNAIDKLEATKAAYKSTQSALEQAEAKLAEARAAGDTKSAEMWEETIETLTEESQEAQENMLSAWEDALDKVAEQFEQSVERIIDSFNKSVYKLGGLEGLADDFSKEQERADMMLDDYEKIYELSKLSRDINKTIDDTDNLAGKQKLKKLLGEINDLQEDGVEMSQYDLEYLQKEYDLRLAEIELEEAQKAKNTVRLQKDNEGNWSYVYTQNADAVDEAQQKYEDALYAMQDLSSNYIDEMSEKLIETSQEMAEALAELRVEDFASIDEYYAEVDRVQKYYQEQMDWQEEELNKAIANNKTLYDEDWTAYHNATGYKISDTEDFVTAFKDSMLGNLMNSESATANFNDLIAGSVETMISSLLEAANTYYENLENAMNAADTSIEDFGEDVGESIDQIADKSAEGAAAVEDMADRMNAAVNGVMDTIQDWQTTYGLAMEDIIKDNLEVIESINDMVGALSLDDYDASVTWNFSKANASAFDTGGYTGNWGKEGKLAVLHEKELVLNADDTVNMLNALKLTTDLLDMLELQTKNAQLGIGNLVANTIKDTQTEVLEQNVHITAEFPSVTDHNEIEEALLNLNNVASQYANRK